MNQEQKSMWEEWLATRPEVVRQMARRYPPGTKFRIHDEVMHVMSYEESGGLSVTATDPAEDYEKAVAERQPLCKCCVGNLDALRV